jgi:hypothetical protein
MIMEMIRMIMRDNRDIRVGIRLCFNKEARTSFFNKGDSLLEGNSSFILDEEDGKLNEISYVVVGWDMASMFIQLLFEDIALMMKSSKRHIEASKTKMAIQVFDRIPCSGVFCRSNGRHWILDCYTSVDKSLSNILDANNAIASTPPHQPPYHLYQTSTVEAVHSLDPQRKQPND